MAEAAVRPKFMTRWKLCEIFFQFSRHKRSVGKILLLSLLFFSTSSQVNFSISRIRSKISRISGFCSEFSNFFFSLKVETRTTTELMEGAALKNDRSP